MAHFSNAFSFEKILGPRDRVEQVAKKKRVTNRKQARPKGTPEHLSGLAAAKWDEIRIEWQIEDKAGLMLLTKAFEAFDRAERCRQQISEQGETIIDRFEQMKPHPLLACERDSRAAFASLIRQLGIEPDED
jgi:phage terminase small subunit